MSITITIAAVLFACLLIYTSDNRKGKLNREAVKYNNKRRFGRS